MNTIDWQALEKDVLAQVVALAEQIGKEWVTQARSDAMDFLNTSKDFLMTTAQQLASGEIDTELFKSELRGRVDDAEFLALEEAGLAQVRFDEFVNGLVKILTSAVTTAAKSLI
jgi:hypothetical protein